MKVVSSLVLLASSVSAFAPSSKPSTTTAVHETASDLESLAKDLNPIVGFWDPLGLATQSFWEDSNEATIGFLRHAEIKHGRVAMAAFVGYCVQSNFHWPWPMTTAGDSFPSTDLSPEAQWDAIPNIAKWQIILVVGFLEAWGESTHEKAHYMRGGQPGYYPSFDLFRETVHPMPFNLFDPLGLSKNASPEKKAKGLKAEINNGRLAQLGIFGFLCADKIEGSVPGISDIAIPYNGDPMAPFASDMTFF